MPALKLTKSSVDKLTLTDGRQEIYWDTDLKGFGVLVGKTSKTYITQVNLAGKAKRVTIGKAGLFTCEEARTEAKEYLYKTARGIDPKPHKKKPSENEFTLGNTFQSFIKERKIKPLTIKDYTSIMNRLFSDWLDLPLKDINKSMVSERHITIRTNIAQSKQDVTRGDLHANGAMRVLRSVYNYAMNKYDDADLPKNPVTILSQNKLWFPERRRQSYITEKNFPKWFKAVKNLNDPLNPTNAETTRDYLIFVVFTGLRRSEAAKLTWDRVDLENSTFKIVETKNRRIHTLPFSGYIYKMLMHRHEKRTSDFVFDWPTVKEGHIMSPERYFEMIEADSNVKFCLHDLRRTFITYANRLDISSYSLKALLNHKDKSDVTEGYIQQDYESLRVPMERISTNLLILGGESTKKRNRLFI